MSRARFLESKTRSSERTVLRYYLLPWISIKMPEGAVWIQKKSEARLCDAGIACCQSLVALLHGHQRADRNLREKFAGGILGQPDAAV